ncbi:MAG: transcription-repair coupling factor [Cardiobacteriaceae bacterium]|nr:transcription-repair coupling factor [Cardiobacteriaceae bacterium]
MKNNNPYAHLAWNLARHLSGKHIHLVVTPDGVSAQYCYETLKFWLDRHEDLYWFSDWETLPYDQYTPHPDLVSERLRVLAELPTRRNGIVVVPVNALRQRLCPQKHLDRFGIHLALGDRLPRADLIARLLEAGYQSAVHVSEKGEYAARGAIVDLFPMGAKAPVRLEWDDDDIDSIRTFAPDTQLTLEKLEKISILPSREIDLSDAGRTCFRQSARQELGERISNSGIYQSLSEGRTPQGLEYYLPLFFDDTATLFDYLPKNTRLVDIPLPEEALARHAEQCRKRYERLNPLREGGLLPPEKLWLSPQETLAHLQGLEKHPLPDHADPIPFSGSVHEREQGWKQHILGREPLVLHFPGQGLREHWHERLIRQHANVTLAERKDLPPAPGHIQLVISPLRASFRGDGVVHLAEADLHTTPPAQNYRQSKTTDPASLIQSLQDLIPGAPVVHIDHGVGRYQGLQMLEGEELLVIEYAKGGKLYVPVTDLDLITRYSGGSAESAPLHELGSKSWATAKRKIRENVHDTAAELLAIYAAREASHGQSIAIDDNALAAFSAGFAYEETPDQIAAIDAVLADLAREQPMDRIVCGDVGFGKTEVAIRAAYAAVLAGKQVALIAPTTLLANQHDHNFTDRFSELAVQIDSLSRFKTAGEQKRILERVANGQTDIVIGTHRLLQKDVQFKNLGLVIIDEEQRFGVRHKEQLKKLRADVNLLTLTATPIPRTLNLALTGLRDLSIIATPPAGRQSVQTILCPWDPAIIEEACERELQRGGQIFFLHNDVDSIERIARSIADTLPQARIAVAHGQMRERELERIMNDFYNRHYDLLIATTIIESGIDIPNANTIIINRADKLGLSQLHQLRGRVGRSHHQAYAYLITPDWNTLNKDAQRRLDAFTTLDSLGAGFLLASQDLEIRGAGEILGDEQSGQIQQIGMSYYLDLLDRAVESLRKGETPNLEEEPPRENIELDIPALLPEDYLPDPQQRLVIYQRLAQSKTPAELDAIAIELVDRFGRLPETARHLIERHRLRLRAAHIGIERIRISDSITLQFRADARINPDAYLKEIQNAPQHYQLAGATTLKIQNLPGNTEDKLAHLNAFLDRIVLENTL